MGRAAEQLKDAPLAGLRVLDLGSYVTGPYAAVLLADMGAEVTKVERWPDGDPFRGWGTDGVSPTFASLNRGKRSVLVETRSTAGRDVVLRMTEEADVLIENFRPGTMDRMGLGYEAVSAHNPEIVYCSISGFGASGPYADRPGYDTVGQAMSWLLGLLTDMDHPLPVGISLADHVTGLFASHGVLAALVKRSIQGRGSLVETSLLQATTSFLAENAARFLAEGEVPTRATRTHLAQAYAFVAGDGLPFVVHLSSPQKFWEGLVASVEMPWLLDDGRFATRKDRIANYPVLNELLTKRFSEGSRAAWLGALARNDVPAGPVNRLDEVFEDPGVRHLGLVRESAAPATGSPMRLVGSAVNVSGFVPGPLPMPPTLGGHTCVVLAELGLSAHEIEALAATGVIKT